MAISATAESLEDRRATHCWLAAARTVKATIGQKRSRLINRRIISSSHDGGAVWSNEPAKTVRPSPSDSLGLVPAASPGGGPDLAVHKAGALDEQRTSDHPAGGPVG